MNDPCTVPVHLHDVSHTLGSRRVLTSISLTVHAGDIVALTGVNGAGKSTLLRICMGELTPDSGCAQLFGDPAQKFSDWQRVGYVQQLPPSGALRHPASVLDIVKANVVLPRSRDNKQDLARLSQTSDSTPPSIEGLLQEAQSKRFSVLSGGIRKHIALWWLRMVGMEEVAKRRIGQLSGGQLQRVRLASALACNPDLLVLDEPTTGLDAQSTQQFCDLITSLHQSRHISILLVTHDMKVARALAHFVYRLEEGSLSPVDVHTTPDALSPTRS